MEGVLLETRHAPIQPEYLVYAIKPKSNAEKQSLMVSSVCSGLSFLCITYNSQGGRVYFSRQTLHQSIDFIEFVRKYLFSSYLLHDQLLNHLLSPFPHCAYHTEYTRSRITLYLAMKATVCKAHSRDSSEFLGRLIVLQAT